jgi:hypothetical protein
MLRLVSSGILEAARPARRADSRREVARNEKTGHDGL